MTTATVIGSGPNGLAAAVVLARAGLEVAVLESEPELGGGLRTEELTFPGFRHDRCSAVHPMAFTSPFFRAFGLSERVAYVNPPIAYAQAIRPGHSAIAYRDLEQTASDLDRDGKAWEALFGLLVSNIDDLAETVLASPLGAPSHPQLLLAFGRRVAQHGIVGIPGGFRTEEAEALFTGLLAHGGTRLPALGTAAIGLVLGAHAHARGWPIPIGGSATVAHAMIEDIRTHGGTFHAQHEVRSISELSSDVVVADVSAQSLARIGERVLPARYVRALTRFRYGNAVAKVDVALAGRVPWADERLGSAGTVHVGGTAQETRASENAVARGEHPANPFILVTQPSEFDPSRAPVDHSVLWAYCHVPAGSHRDMSEAILGRLECFAPGLRDQILATHSSAATHVAAHNANYVHGDIASGTPSLRQLVARPVFSRTPWRTPRKGLYLASASTCPGPGIHGMAGYHAASLALKDLGAPVPNLCP